VEYSDSMVIDLLKQGNEKAFEWLFKDHIQGLHTYAFTFINKMK
jgi:RNA polymerase sigma-70 factor (ECF subfamily)